MSNYDDLSDDAMVECFVVLLFEAAATREEGRIEKVVDLFSDVTKKLSSGRLSGLQRILSEESRFGSKPWSVLADLVEGELALRSLSGK